MNKSFLLFYSPSLGAKYKFQYIENGLFRTFFPIPRPLKSVMLIPGVLPYTGETGMCRPLGYVFWGIEP